MENVLGLGGHRLGGKDNHECSEYHNFLHVCCKTAIPSNCLYRVNLSNNVKVFLSLFHIFKYFFLKNMLDELKYKLVITCMHIWNKEFWNQPLCEELNS